MLKSMLRVVVSVCLVVVLPACRSAPRHVTLSTLEDADQAERLADEYWSITPEPLAAASAGNSHLGAYTVVFITAKKEMPFESQPVAGMPPITPFAIGLELTGLGQKRVAFDADLEDRVGATLRDAFTTALTTRDRSLGDGASLLETAALRELRTTNGTQTSVVQLANFLSSDTGQVRAAHARPAPGSRMIAAADAGEKLAPTIQLALGESGASEAYIVRMRLGLYRSRAVLESGSFVEVVTADGPTREARLLRSLVSERSVVASSKFKPVTGDRYVLDDDAFEQAVDRLAQVAFDLLTRQLFEPSATSTVSIAR